MRKRRGGEVPLPASGLPVVEGYSVAGEIGRGGSAVVYLAQQRVLGRDEAIKVISNAQADALALDRFRRECLALGPIGWHPNIVTVYGAGSTAQGQPYLAMEHLPGGTLSDRIRRAGTLDWHDVVVIGVKLAAGLETAHAAARLHCDVKPANVMFSSAGEPVLTDTRVGSSPGVTPSTSATEPNSASPRERLRSSLCSARDRVVIPARA
jgi:serine/threonine-protein kinase PknK